jgi:parvulin-like peptidyl-prolyl isomerase
VGLQRLALLAFGGLLVLLFLGFAVVQGIGNPSVPSGDVAVIEDAPGDLGTVSEADLETAIAQTAGQSGVKPVPKPGDPQYDELKKAAFEELLTRIWIQGEAEELGISVTPEEVSDEFEKLKKQAFKTEAQYQKFLKEANFTQAQIDEQIKVQMLIKQIQQQATENAPTPSDGEIEDYYEAARATQFTQPETRDVRVIENKDRAQAEEVKTELEKDDSAATWKRLAAKFDSGTGKKTGGLLKGLTDGQAPEPLNAAAFAAPPSQVEGLLKGPSGFIVFEVVKETAEKVQPLAEVKPQISSQLAEQAQQQQSARLIRNYASKWESRTFCAADFTIERCANFKGSGHPASAPPACYEANPKGPAPEACPAPVQQVTPALPGTVGVLTPEGQKLAQRPRPSKLEAAPEAAAGLPPITPGE